MGTDKHKHSTFFTVILTALFLNLPACALLQPAHNTQVDLFVGTTFEVNFAPSIQTEKAIIRFIAEAKKSVHVAAYAFTSQPIANALLAAWTQGVDVRVVVDKTQSAGRHSVAEFLVQNCVPVRVNSAYRIQHQKIMVVDSRDVETGSYNFTNNARDHNSENVLIIRNVPSLASKYEENWVKMWGESSDFR